MRRCLPLVLTACGPRFENVDAACPDQLDGASLVASESAEVLERINCWRRYLGLYPLGVEARAQAAAEAHLAYLAKQDALDPSSPLYDARRASLLYEREGLEPFYGGDPYARLVKAGLAAANDGNALAGSWGWPALDPEATGDAWIAQPWARDLLLQPGVVGVGLARGKVSGKTLSYLELFATLPSGRNTLRPVVLPGDGQTGVPTWYVDPDAGQGDLLTRVAPFGFPISLTVSTWQLGTDDFDPYGIEVDQDVRLAPVGGDPVAVHVIEPGQNLPMPMRTTVVVLPDAPLEPRTEYELSVTIGTRVVVYDVTTRFTTGDGGVPADTDTETDTDETDDTDEVE